MKNKHDVFIKMAFLMSDESKCVSHHVGAVVVREERIVVTGYNGSPPGLPNCCDVFDKEDFDRVEHSKWSADNEIHAEMNAFAFAAKYDIGIDGCDMYTTISPCNECLKNMTMTGIKNVYYLYKYDRIAVNPTLLQKINVQEVPGAEELKLWVEKFGLLYKGKSK